MKKGEKIEMESFDIIENSVDLSKFSEDEKIVVKRVIHASGDVEFAKLIYFSQNWLAAFKDILQSKPAVICDVNMVKAGITEKYLKISGLKTYCFIADDYIVEKAQKNNKTRAEVSMEYVFDKFDNMIFVIGNAPTALLKVIELNRGNGDRKIFVIGMPVGFVKAAESKKLLVDSNIPCITSFGPKGGSGVASATFNALIKLYYGF